MTLRRQRIVLWLSGAVTCVLAIFSLGLGIGLPYTHRDAELSRTRSAKAHGINLASEPSLVTLQASAQLDLQRPLFDAPPPAPAPVVVPPPPPPLAVQLAGTIIEPGHNQAMLVGPDGKTELKSVGESSGSAKILEINQDNCVVQYLGSRVTLKIAKDNTGK